MSFHPASLSRSFSLVLALTNVLGSTAQIRGVQLSSEPQSVTVSASLRQPAHNTFHDSVSTSMAMRPAAHNQGNTFHDFVDASQKPLQQTTPKTEDVALTQRMVSMNFVNSDWATGCVWGFLIGWVAAVVWAAPAVFAASTRSPSHIGQSTPVWPVNHAASCMAGWGAFCATFWMLQWFIPVLYCFLASLFAAVVAFMIGNQVVSSGKDLSTAVTWSMVGTCCLVTLLTVVLVVSNHSQPQAVQASSKF